jgi:hypothetical protein
MPSQLLSQPDVIQYTQTPATIDHTRPSIMCEVTFSVYPECTQLHRVRMEYCAPMRRILRAQEDEGPGVTMWRIRHGLHWSPMGDCKSLTVNKIGESRLCTDPPAVSRATLQ